MRKRSPVNCSNQCGDAVAVARSNEHLMMLGVRRSLCVSLLSFSPTLTQKCTLSPLPVVSLTYANCCTAESVSQLQLPSSHYSLNRRKNPTETTHICLEQTFFQSSKRGEACSSDRHCGALISAKGVCIGTHELLFIFSL